MLSFKKRNIVLSVILCAVVFIFCNLASAYSQEYDKHYIRAQELYKLGKYKEAQTEFEKARQVLHASENPAGVIIKKELSEIPKQSDSGKDARKIINDSERLDNENELLQNEIKRIKKERKEFQDKLEKANAKLKKKNKPQEELFQKIKQLELTLINKDERLQQDQVLIETVNNEKKSLAEELLVVKQELIDLYQKKDVTIKPVVTSDNTFLGGLFGAKKEAYEEKPALSIRDQLEHYEILKAEKNNLEEALRKVNESNLAQNKKQEQLQHDIKKAEEDLGLKESEKQKIVLENKLFEQIIMTLEKQQEELAGKSADSGQVTEQIKQMQVQLDQKKQELEQAKNQIAQIQKEKEAFLAETETQAKDDKVVAQLENKLKAMQASLDDKAEKTQTLEAELAGLNKKNEELNKQILLTQNNSKGLQEQKDALAKEKEKLARDYKQELEKIENLQSELNQVKQTLKSQDADIIKKDAQIARIDKELALNQQEKDSILTKNSMLEKTNKALEQEKSISGKKNSSAEKLEKRISELETLIAKSNEVKDDLSQQLKETQKVKKDLESQILVLNKNISSLEEENKNINSKRDNLAQQNQTASLEQEKLKTDLNNSKLESEKMSKDFAKINLERADLEAKIAKLRIELDALAKENVGLASQNKSLAKVENTVSLLKNDLLAKGKEFEVIIEKNNKLIQLNAEQNKQLDALGKQLSGVEQGKQAIAAKADSLEADKKLIMQEKLALAAQTQEQLKQISSKQKEIEVLTKKINDLGNTKSSQKEILAENNALRASYDQLKNQFQNAEAELKQKNQDLVVLENALKNTQTNLSAAQAKAEELAKIEKDLTSKSKAVVAELAEIKQSSNDINSLTEQLKQLEALLKEKESVQIQLRSEIASSNNQRQEISSQLAAAQAKIADLQSQTTIKTDSNQEVIDQIAELSNQKQQIMEKYQKLFDQMKEQNLKIKDLEKTLNAVRADLEKSESEKVVMAEEIISLREEKAGFINE
ncbi:MAG: hypothetical protein V1747_05450 [Candidatus Omnitrophota bacterium]